MVDSEYEIAATKRIAHIRGHLEGGFPTLSSAVRNIENGLGSPKGSAMNLSRHAEAKAMSCWCEARDLRSMQQWFYVAARLQKLIYEIKTDTLGPGKRRLI